MPLASLAACYLLNYVCYLLNYSSTTCTMDTNLYKLIMVTSYHATLLECMRRISTYTALHCSTMLFTAIAIFHSLSLYSCCTYMILLIFGSFGLIICNIIYKLIIVTSYSCYSIRIHATYIYILRCTAQLCYLLLLLYSILYR